MLNVGFIQCVQELHVVSQAKAELNVRLADVSLEWV